MNSKILLSEIAFLQYVCLAIDPVGSKILFHGRNNIKNVSSFSTFVLLTPCDYNTTFRSSTFGFGGCVLTLFNVKVVLSPY